MKYLLTLLICCFYLSLSAQTLSAQKMYLISGTVITAEIGIDGIVICADSRAITSNNIDKTRYYYDSTTKIIQLKSILLARCGLATLGNRNLFDVLKTMSESYDWHDDLKLFLQYFLTYIKSRYTSEQISELDEGNSHFIIATFQKNKPILINFKLKDLSNNTVNSYSSYTTADPIMEYLHYDPNLKCAELGKIAENAIIKFIKDFNMQWCIGGPITIAQLNPDNTVKWIQNNFQDKMLPTKMTLVNPLDVIISDSLSNQWSLSHHK